MLLATWFCRKKKKKKKSKREGKLSEVQKYIERRERGRKKKLKLFPFHHGSRDQRPGQIEGNRD